MKPEEPVVRISDELVLNIGEVAGVETRLDGHYVIERDGKTAHLVKPIYVIPLMEALRCWPRKV